MLTLITGWQTLLNRSALSFSALGKDRAITERPVNRRKIGASQIEFNSRQLHEFSQIACGAVTTGKNWCGVIFHNAVIKDRKF